MQRLIVGVAGALVLAACSVATPRDGSMLAAGRELRATTADVASATGSAGPSGGALAAGATSHEPVGSGAVGASAVGRGASPDVSVPGKGGTATGAGATPGTGGTANRAPAQPAAAQATAAGSTVGVTADSITISLLAGYSGPYGGLFKTWADNAFGLWVAEVNAHGGIHGRKLVLKQVDNRDAAEGGVAACKEVQGNGSFMAISMAGLAGADMSSSDCLDKARIPVVAFNLAGYRDHWRYVISANDDAKQAVPIASLIKNVIGDGAGKTGMIVVNDPIQFAARDAINRELDRLGMTHVRDETISAGQGSFVAELSRLRSAGATTVVMVTGNESVGIVRDAKAMGYSPHFTGMFWTLDEFSQPAGQLWQGIKAVRVFPTTESAVYAEYKKKATQYGFESVSGTTVMAYYGGAILTSDILTKIGPALGRDAVPRAAGQLGEYSNGILALSFPSGGLVPDVKDFPIVCCNADNTWKGIGEPRLEF
jgi:branched-chain amino acid transport system substrate-binding protein